MATLVIGLDVERLGRYRPIVAVGIAAIVLDTNGDTSVLSKNLIRVKADWSDMSEGCREGFWSKQPESLIEFLKQDAVEPWLAGRKIAELNKEILAVAKAGGYSVVYTSDFPVYDVGAINELLRHPHVQAEAIPFCGRDCPYDVIDCGTEGASHWFTAEQRRDCIEFAKKHVTHDHNPANDAHYSAMRYVAARRFVSCTR